MIILNDNKMGNKQKYRIVKTRFGFIIQIKYFEPEWSWRKFKFVPNEYWSMAQEDGMPRTYFRYNLLRPHKSDLIAPFKTIDEAKAKIDELERILQFKDKVVFET